jgi:two-component system LytT family sensor kinase
VWGEWRQGGVNGTLAGSTGRTFPLSPTDDQVNFQGYGSTSRTERIDALSSEEVPFRFGPRDHLINLGFWTLFGAVTVAVFLSNDYDPTGHGSLLLEAAGWFVHAYLWAAATPLIFWIVWRVEAMSAARPVRIILLVVAAILIALVVAVARDVVWTQLLGFPASRKASNLSRYLMGQVRPLSEPVECGSIFVTGFVRRQLLRIRAREEQAIRLQARAAEMEAHAAQLQAQLAQARLAVLRSQLNPHFLFNTLHAISVLIHDDPAGADAMIARLSDLLRYALEDREGEEIRLGEELKLTRHYLEILQIRFQGRLETTVSAGPDVDDALVPNLILQPLVENAMKHGVAKAGGRGRIEVDARRSGESLVLTVRDTGGGENAHGPAEIGSAGAGTGVGLANVRARLQELYGPDQRLSLQPVPGGGMAAEIVLPFRAASTPVNSRG